ncbi:MAG: phosphotransferase [Algoriphagus sp.]|jgi:5-methylthioribose kinase|uniref:phosphotransferase n=1 Tax=Algoriphagus sp. TaxID=1872435 RepID=UPI00275C9B58|nr:phosphotransferase [Algoriphagus sp.]MDP4747650.1 phosphotransferase [Algoriphagus sp.]
MIDIQQNSPIELLQSLDFWLPGEKISQISIPGESNMNLVLRIKTNVRSYILKQAKPYVRKYPHILAPISRIQIEYQFLKQLEDNSFLASLSPKVLQYDAHQHLMLLEDLGEGSDYLALYEGNRMLNRMEIRQLVDYLLHLHQLQAPTFPPTNTMRSLNHEHIFNFPFLKENGFNLDSVQSGLQEASIPYKTDPLLKERIQALGIRYLAEGKGLMHGDFYPGSWLQVPSGIKIIDPEFGGLGDAEFDLGIFLAHLDLSEQAEELSSLVQKQYTLPADWSLVQQYRGVEILRRLIGIAQLPVSLSLEAKKTLLARARTYLLS